MYQIELPRTYLSERSVIICRYVGKVVASLVVGLIGASGTGLGVAVSQYEPVLKEGAVVGVIPVGGLSPTEAAKRVRLWWEGERTKKASFKSAVMDDLPPSQRWDQIGLRVDDNASIAQVPLQDFWQASSLRMGLQQSAESKFPLVFLVDDARAAEAAKFVKERQPAKSQARVTWVKGAISRQFERPGLKLDVEAYKTAVIDAFSESKPIDLPLIEGEKKVPDDQLRRIVEPMATFSTRFSASNRPRSSNIALAASKINGLVLMPGETFSFNTIVGPRTLGRGYKLAGVLVRGRLDEGIGGGICQVSTTLYNAALLAGLKITERKNHSSRVPYVAVGLDCAVSYGQLDLIFENTASHPIALATAVGGGTIEFKILGVKVPGRVITIERSRQQSWSRGVEYKHDPSLPFGRVVVIDKGATAHRVSTWRVIRQDGKVVKREPLGESYYPGAPRLLGKNMKAKAPAPQPAAAMDAPEAAPLESPVEPNE